MLEKAIKQIESCKSLDELQALWLDNLEAWGRLPGDEAQQLIECKNGKRDELKIRIHRRIMLSPILGEVEVVFDQDNPDQATVDGVVYDQGELRDLLSRKLNRDEIRATHKVKKEFDGAVIPSGQEAEGHVCHEACSS